MYLIVPNTQFSLTNTCLVVCSEPARLDVSLAFQNASPRLPSNSRDVGHHGSGGSKLFMFGIETT